MVKLYNPDSFIFIWQILKKSNYIRYITPILSNSVYFLIVKLYAKLLFYIFTFLIKITYRSPKTATTFQPDTHTKMIRLSYLAENLFRILTVFVSKKTRYSFTMPIKYENSTILIRPYIFSEIIMVSGLWEPYVKSIVDKDIGDNDVVIDIGANIGIYAIPLAKRVKKVIAVEPHPKTFEMLEKSIQLNNLKNIILIKKAISDSGKKILFNLSIRPMESGIASSNKTDSTIEVDSIDLDSMLSAENKVNWLIIDVEGLEVCVLIGAKNLLRKFHPKIIIEVQNYDKVKEILINEGYSIEHLSYKYYYAR
jgi:FkbM family methyltransferase